MDEKAQSERQPISSESRPLENELRRTHLTPLEHAVIRSSLVVDGVHFGGEEILRKGSRFYLRPFGLPPDAAPEVIASFSKKREDRFLEGYLLGMFDPDPELIEGGYTHKLWLSGIDAAGFVDPRLRIQLIDGEDKVVTDQKLLDKVKLDIDAPSGFRNEPEVNPDTQEKTGDFYLSFEQPDNS